MQLYKKFLRAEELGVSIDKVPSKVSENAAKFLDTAIRAGVNILGY